MLSLDAMLENPKTTIHEHVEACLTSCLSCQQGLVDFRVRLGVTVDELMERDDLWVLLCEIHSPWIRAKVDGVFLPSVRADIDRLTKQLADMPTCDDIIGRMANGEDMFRRQVINQERFDKRFAELEKLLLERESLANDLVYWKVVLGYATADEMIEEPE